MSIKLEEEIFRITESYCSASEWNKNTVGIM